MYDEKTFKTGESGFGDAVRCLNLSNLFQITSTARLMPRGTPYGPPHGLMQAVVIDATFSVYAGWVAVAATVNLTVRTLFAS
jgi:hypothetical protein